MVAKTLKEVFTQAQYSTHQHEQLLSSVVDNYRCTCASSEDNVEEFCERFIGLLKYILVEYKPEPNVERLVRFVAKVIAKAGNDQTLYTVFDRVVNFLLESHEANDKAVRYRVCQLIALTIDLLGDAELDDEICDRIFQCMHARLSDKLPAVRVQAIKSLSRLQDPSDKRCPVIKAFLFLMSSDPNWQVRVECLRCVAPTKRSLLAMIERTRDVNELIRKTAYHVIAEKVSVKALSISQRLSLLENGLADRSVNVQKVCTDKLLPAWLVHYQANILDLLCGLDIMSSGDICEKAVNLIVKKVPIEEILEEFDLLDEKHLILEEKLSCESVFYYRVLLQYISQLGDSAVDSMEKITPDPKVFMQYITEIAATLTHDEAEFEKKASTEYILQQLVQCIEYIDISDPVSRKSVLTLCKDLLSSDDLSLSLTPQLMQCLVQVLRVPQERMDEVATIISDIQVPNVMEEVPVDPDTMHQLKYKLARVKMNLNELTEMMADAVNKQDFVSAAEIKEKMVILEESKVALTEEMKPKPVPVPSETRNDVATTLKCLTIFVELMTSGDMNTMTDTVRSHMEELVIPAVPHSSPAVRNQAIKALGLCSLNEKEVAQKFLPIFLQVCRLDDETIRVSALESLFDIILVHDMECFQETESKLSPSDDADQDNSMDGSQHKPDDEEDKENRGSPVDVASDSEEESTDSQVYRSANDFIKMLVEYLDDESSIIRTLCAEGLCKLLLSSRIVSSKLLSRLILLWYNPITEDDVKLRHCLGVFLPVYAFASRANQLQVEEAFIPTLQVIFDAPTTSPLSDIDEYNVIQLFVQLTHAQEVKDATEGTNEVSGMTSHDSLAIRICNELIERENSYGVAQLAKALTMLDISVDNEILAKDMKNLCKRLTQVVKDKTAAKTIEKFRVKVEALKSADVDTLVLEEGQGSSEAVADEDDNVAADVEEKENDEIDSTALDTTSLSTSRLKRAATRNNTSRIQSSRQTRDAADDSSSSSASENTSTRGKRKTKVPKIDEDSD